jgi:hypothetical protein
MKIERNKGQAKAERIIINKTGKQTNKEKREKI